MQVKATDECIDQDIEDLLITEHPLIVTYVMHTILLIQFSLATIFHIKTQYKEKS